MPVPNATTIQAYTDQIAAKMRAALAGFANESTLKTVPSLYDQLVAGGGGLTAGIGADALATDRFGFPEQANAQLTELFTRPDLSAQAAGLVAYLRSAQGGSYATLSAYLTDKGATLDPLFAELIRVKGGDLLGAGSAPIGVFAPSYAAQFAAQVLAGADGALNDITTAAGNATTADMTIFAANGNSVYIRSRSPFTRAIFGLSTLANVGVGYTPQYWNGNGYVNVPGLVDNAAGCTLNDTIAWTLPTDWEPNYKDAAGNAFPNEQARLYTIKLTRATVTVATPPVGTCLTVIPTRQLISPAGTLGTDLPLPQPPLALIRVTGANSGVVEVVASPDSLRFVPGGIQFRALTPIGATDTIGIAYVNQSNASQTQAQSGWASPAALATKAVALSGADTGVKAINAAGWTFANLIGGVGVIAVEITPVRSTSV